MLHGQRPSSDCRHPERYTAADIIATENEVIELVAAFVRALQPDYVLETGTYKGHAAQAIGEALKRNGYGHLDTVEINDDHAREAFERCAGLPVTVHTMSSLDFVPAKPIEFAWIDSHFSTRAAELQRFRRYFRPGCIIGMHDTGDWAKLRERLEPVLQQGWLEFLYLPTYRGVAFGRVG